MGSIRHLVSVSVFLRQTRSNIVSDRGHCRIFSVIFREGNNNNII